MHWYLEYVDKYRKLCQNSGSHYSKCNRYSDCSWCKKFRDFMEKDIGRRDDVSPYVHATIESYREAYRKACAISRDREEKYAVFQRIPSPFLKYYKLSSFESSFKNLSWDKINAIETNAELYKKYRKNIAKEIVDRATKEYECACQLEKITATTPTVRFQSTKTELVPEIIFKKCKKCGCSIMAGEKYCSKCDPYRDLHIATDKLQTNLGAFRTKAPLFAPSMRPIDVPAAEYSRFENAASKDGPEIDEYIKPEKKKVAQPLPKTKNTGDLYQRVKDDYEARAFDIMANISKKEIYAKEDLFFELAIALRISGWRVWLTEYVDEYALVNYRK